MRTIATVTLILVFAGVAAAALPLFESGTAIQMPDSRDALYCQPIAGNFSALQASSGYDSEFADDLPDGLAGQGLTSVTLYVGEWNLAPDWREPDGIVINFYYSQCPPTLDPDLTYSFAWSELAPELVYSGSWITYRVTAQLPETVIMAAEMSMGAYVLTPWGANDPLCGIGVTNMSEFYGCDYGWLDAQAWGYVRWTTTNWPAPGFGYDMAYCLEGGPVANETMSWGQVRALYR